MNRYVVAVSGGVDSVVLLDKLVKRGNLDLAVAHFDHGIRGGSADDARFVGALAKKYDLKFESERRELGSNASEELAREERYRFLYDVARKYNAKLVTAHHLDDLVETVTINLTRGTGWRGLAAMGRSGIWRPLIDTPKKELIKYAIENNLEWWEDETNLSGKYLRNRLRRKTMGLDISVKERLFHLWTRQKQLKEDIESEVRLLLPGPKYSRYFFIMIDEAVARECLRVLTEGKMTRPQLQAALLAIKTWQSGKIYQVGDVKIDLTARNFTVKLIK